MIESILNNPLIVIIMGSFIVAVLVILRRSSKRKRQELEFKLEVEQYRQEIEELRSEVSTLKEEKQEGDHKELKRRRLERDRLEVERQHQELECRRLVRERVESERQHQEIERRRLERDRLEAERLHKELQSLRDLGYLEDKDLPSYSRPGFDYDERVEFATFAPRSITPNCSFILDVWAYLPNQYSLITAYARELERDVNLGRKTGVPVPRGAILTIALNIEGLEVQDPIDTVVWSGVPTNASFIIKVPADCAIGKYSGRVVIKYQGVAIAKIVFLISVETAKTPDYVDQSTEILYPKSAFASYASANREEVLSRIQGMKKVAPELGIFIDVFSLRSGQDWQEKLEQHVPNKDTFYLFWSEPAAHSKWVEREWRLALSRRGLNYIDPVPLEEPDRVPPPQELRALHFSDAYIAYIKYQNLKKQMQTQG